MEKNSSNVIKVKINLENIFKRDSCFISWKANFVKMAKKQKKIVLIICLDFLMPAIISK